MNMAVLLKEEQERLRAEFEAQVHAAVRPQCPCERCKAQRIVIVEADVFTAEDREWMRELEEAFR